MNPYNPTGNERPESIMHTIGQQMMQLSRVMGSAIRRFDVDLRTASATMSGTATGAGSQFLDTISQVHQAYGPSATGGRPGIDVAPSIGRELMMSLRLATPRQMRGMTGPEIDYYVRRNWEQRFQDLRDWTAMPVEAIPRIFGADTSRGITRLGRDIEGLSQSWVRAPYSEGTIRGTGFTREQAREVAGGMLMYRREAVTEFNRRELNEMTGLAGSLGYFDNTRGVEDFQQRFRELTSGVSRIMRVLRTSYQEGVAVMSQLREMGVTDYAGATDRLRMQSAMTGLSPAHVMQYAGTFAPQLRNMMPGMSANSSFRVATGLAGARDPRLTIDFMGNRVNQMAFMRSDGGRFSYDHNLLTSFLGGEVGYQDLLTGAGRNYGGLSLDQQLQFENQRGDMFSGMPAAMIPMIGPMVAVRRALDLANGDTNLATIIMRQNGMSEQEIENALRMYRDYLEDPGMIGRMTARERILARQANEAPVSTWQTLGAYGVGGLRILGSVGTMGYDALVGSRITGGAGRIGRQRSREMALQIEEIGVDIPRSMRGVDFMQQYNLTRERLISAMDGEAAPMDLRERLGDRYQDFRAMTQRGGLTPTQLIAEAYMYGLQTEEELGAVYHHVSGRFSKDAIRKTMHFEISGAGPVEDLLWSRISRGDAEARRTHLMRTYSSRARKPNVGHAFREIAGIPDTQGRVIRDINQKLLDHPGMIDDLRAAAGSSQKMQKVIDQYNLDDRGLSLGELMNLAGKATEFHDEAYGVGRTRAEELAEHLRGGFISHAGVVGLSESVLSKEGLARLMEEWEQIQAEGKLPLDAIRFTSQARGLEYRSAEVFKQLNPIMSSIIAEQRKSELGIKEYLGKELGATQLSTSPTVDARGISASIEDSMYAPVIQELVNTIMNLSNINRDTAIINEHMLRRIAAVEKEKGM